MKTFSTVRLVSINSNAMPFFEGRVKGINALIELVNARITKGEEMGSALSTEKKMEAAYLRLKGLNNVSRQIDPKGLYADQLEVLNNQMKEAYGIFHSA